MEILLNSTLLKLDAKSIIGIGGEAEVYDIGNGRVLKVFKKPSHPDFVGQPQAQQAAEARLIEHQKKLRQFPKLLTKNVIAPLQLATDKSGQKITGYSMKFLKQTEVLRRYGERSFRQQGIGADQVRDIFLDLHQTVGAVHQSGVVIGDFNDLNVLVKDRSAYLIDADSFQFGNFQCRVFTAKFVDPVLCDPQLTSLNLVKPHTADSDWYAYAVMLMQSLLYVDPYGGIYRPSKGININHDQRPLKRLTVFHPDVRFPKPAIHYSFLPDDLLQQFHQVFEKDLRGIFPAVLVEKLRWTTCSKCGIEHARVQCPKCQQAAPAAVKEKIVIRGNVTATRIFSTPGVILNAAIDNGSPRWVYHESGKYKRESGETVLPGDLDPQMRIRICGNGTVLAKDGQVVVADKEQRRYAASYFRNRTMAETNGGELFWINQGQLLKEGEHGSQYIGDVLDGQTCFWVGQQLGFGFYQAGGLKVGFVFDPRKRGLNDSVQLPRYPGKLIDADCAIAKERCWFFQSWQENGRTINRCLVIKADGSIEAEAEARLGDGSWLGNIKGKTAAGSLLFASTDDGIIRLEPDQGRITVTREFPETEPFVDGNTRLLVGASGLYAIGQRDITLLEIK